ncbi:MAG TPA: class I SAM-dependent methyltransferase [Rhabdochlamydiaceae bacterium]|nr:class I SAM-dependent methyltransferase [Rhabdochlamydiaceae bacterium]
MKSRNIWIIAFLFLVLLLPTTILLRKKAPKAASEPIRHPFATKAQKEELFRLFKGLEIKTLIDIPCGDVQWIYEIKSFISGYFGIDSEEKVLQKNRERYGGGSIHFQNLDISKDPLPEADLIFCHDALNTLSQNEILASLLLFKKSGAKYLLLTTCPDKEKNQKGKKGVYRPIHWQLPPYNFPKPLLLLNDPTEQNKKLALWRLEDL